MVLLALWPLGPTLEAETKWRKSPKPKFPSEALKAFVEGSVAVRAVIASDGSVVNVDVMKSSGDAQLDNAAVQSVLKWKMEPASITPADLKEGHRIVFDFAQEAMPAAIYRDRLAWFEGKSTGPWVFAPFPAYPESARRRREQGQVQLIARIGTDCRVAEVRVSKSSGYSDLDNAAMTATRHWRTHKQYAGKQVRFPCTFTLRTR